jgi:hypothetical protein
VKTLAVAAALATSLASQARGAEGIVEINQATAIAGNVTPGDAPDFPVTLSQRGSYRLTGNLAVTASTADAIAITADGVTLDLGGFALAGPGTGSGHGVSMSGRRRVEIRGGTIRGFGGSGVRDALATARGHRVAALRVRAMGGSGISLAGAGHTVEDVVVLGCGAGISVGDGGSVRESAVIDVPGAGIAAGTGGIVSGNVVYGAAGDGLGGQGIAVSGGSSVLGNAVRGASASGIVVNGSAVEGNAVTRNAGGIVASDGSTVAENAAGANTLAGIAAIQRVSIRSNTCADNAGDGIAGVLAGIAVEENALLSNTGLGIRLNGGNAYARNAMQSNAGGTIGSDPGQGTPTALGPNLCNGSTSCP